MNNVCAACGGEMSSARTTLGMVTCSGPCNARRRRETGLIDIGQGVGRAEADGFIDESWRGPRERPFIPIMTLAEEVPTGRTHEWRRGFTAGVVIGLVCGLVLPLVALVGGDARADVAGPGGGPQTYTECLTVLRDVDTEATTITHALMDAQRARDTAMAERDDLVDDVDRLTRRTHRQAATIARLRDRLAR